MGTRRALTESWDSHTDCEGASSTVPFTATIMHVGGDDDDVPRVAASLALAIQWALQALQSEAARQNSPVHWTASHWEAEAGVGNPLPAHTAWSTTTARPVALEDSTHCTVRVR
jgi:hypothetical protein